MYFLFSGTWVDPYVTLFFVVNIEAPSPLEMAYAVMSYALKSASWGRIVCSHTSLVDYVCEIYMFCSWDAHDVLNSLLVRAKLTLLISVCAQPEQP